MPSESKLIKRIIDIVISWLALVVLSPLMAYIALRVKLSSPGNVLYRQIRVGLAGKKFVLLKFRSMHSDAEKTGPRLSEKNDPRITPWGRRMRKWKLDELPQLWNVLKGEMSLVGPRPEREFYISQLPGFDRLLQVKPGLTSMGMIRFGYAENIAEMKERMQYDLDYLGKANMLTDISIIMQTIRLVLHAKGR